MKRPWPAMHRVRWKLAAALVGMLAVVVVWSAPVAGATQVDCKEVSYNERVILVCTSNPNATTPTATAVPTPTPTIEPGPTVTTTPVALDGEVDGENDEDAADDDAAISGSDSVDEPTSEPSDGEAADPDQGDRPETDLEDRPEVDGATDAASEDGDLEPVDLPDGDTPEPSAVAPDASTPVDIADEEAVDGRAFVFDTTPDPPSDKTPLVAASVVLAALGSVFLLAARRVRAGGVTRYPGGDQAATSDGGRRSPG